MRGSWADYARDHGLPDEVPPCPYLCAVCCGELAWNGHCIYCESEDSDETDSDE